MDVTLEDYLGCWISIEPSALTIETGQGNSTFYLEGDKLVFIHHKASERSSDMSVRYLTRLDCKEMLEREAPSGIHITPEDKI